MSREEMRVTSSVRGEERHHWATRATAPPAHLRASSPSAQRAWPASARGTASAMSQAKHGAPLRKQGTSADGFMSFIEEAKQRRPFSWAHEHLPHQQAIEPRLSYYWVSVHTLDDEVHPYNITQAIFGFGSNIRSST